MQFTLPDVHKTFDRVMEVVSGLSNRFGVMDKFLKIMDTVIISLKQNVCRFFVPYLKEMDSGSKLMENVVTY